MPFGGGLSLIFHPSIFALRIGPLNYDASLVRQVIRRLDR